METSYEGRQIVGMDLHWRRSVLVQMATSGSPIARRSCAGRSPGPGKSARVALGVPAGGTGQSAPSSRRVPRCIWRTRWGRRRTPTAGSKRPAGRR